ncbi:MAG TPA: trypsin-like peptidase domain-containing protein [Planctomycetota bacterium]|nr:trypsin-like peptidase domain-containing protein [Planctomycetota bacterium]
MRTLSADSAPLVEVPAPDVAFYMADDEARGHRPLRYGALIDVDLSLADGAWSELADGSRVWRMRVASEGAHSLALEFETFDLPEGGQMFVYSDQVEFVFGAYTDENEHYDGTFVFEPYPGSEFILEIDVPAGAEDPVVDVSTVIYDYRGVYGLMDGSVTVGGTKTTGCLIDVNCPEGNGWDNQKRATVRTLSGGALCSGALLNNTNQDETNYVLTANHCGQTSSTVFRFGYEKPGCRTGTAPTTMSVSGATVLTSTSTYDSRLLRINTAIPSSYNPYYAGWTRTTTNSTFAFSMGHPGGGPKKISIDGNGSNGSTNDWIVTWSAGMLEGGSSGGPLFDQNGLVRGPACCVTNFTCGFQTAYYGRFDRFYTSNNLAQWLDPTGSGAFSLDGLDPNGPPGCPNPVVYCSPKVSSNLCVPTIGATGSASLSNPSSFVITTTQMESQVTGIGIFGTGGQAAVPFQGGLLCVGGVVNRLPGKFTGGATPCAGSFSYTLGDVLLHPAGGSLTVGMQFQMQSWTRDLGDPFGSSLSAGLDTVICP